MNAIGLDLGGTKLAGALFSPDGDILHRSSTPLEGRSGAAVGALIAGEARALAARSTAGVSGVGVCIPGIYRAASGTVWAPNIAGWDDYPLVAELSAALPGVGVRVDSDRACAILGEAWRGNARGCRNAIFLVVGTGIGAGILCEGVVLRGAGDAAGAIGWLALDRPYRSDVYPAVGCFEYHASGSGLAAVAREQLARHPEHNSMLRAQALDAITAQDVFAAYDTGDELAVRVLDEAIGYWGMTVANLVSLFNPEKIIMGGGVFGPAVRFLDRILAEAKLWAQPISITQVSLEPSALGGDAVLYGAGALALAASKSQPGVVA